MLVMVLMVLMARHFFFSFQTIYIININDCVFMLCPVLKKMRFKICLAGFVQGRYLMEKVKLCE